MRTRKENKQTIIETCAEVSGVETISNDMRNVGGLATHVD